MIRNNRFAEALAVQDACNISGVARSFVEVIDNARHSPRVGKIENSVYDPAVILFAYKIASLIGMDYPNKIVNDAWEECERRKDRVA